MDIKREGVVKKKMIRRVIYLMIAAAVVALAGWRVSQLKPAAPPSKWRPSGPTP